MAETIARLALALTLLLTAAACSSPPEGGADAGTDAGVNDGADGGVIDGGGTDGGSAGPVTVTWTEDLAGRAAAVLGRAGGEVEATGADGARYTLQVPAGALASELEISLTPLVDLQVDGALAAGSAGVVIEPHGTVLAVPATLTVVPDEAATSPMAVTWVEARPGLFAPLTEPAAQAAPAPLSHFSAYVVVEVDGARVERSIRHAAQSLAEQPVTDWVEALALLAVRADGLQEADAAAQARETIEAEAAQVAVAAEDRSSADGPEDGAALGLTGQAAAQAGAADAAARLQEAAVAVFDAWLASLQADVSASPEWSLEPPVRNTVVLADAWVPERSDAARTLAETLAVALKIGADAACDDWRFDEGRGALEQLVAFVTDLGLEAPSADELLDDAATCVPPTIVRVVAANLASGSDAVAGARLILPGASESLRDPAEVPATERDGCGFVSGGGVELGTGGFEATLSAQGHAAAWTTEAALEPDGTGLTVSLTGSASSTPVDGPAIVTDTAAEGFTRIPALTLEIDNPRGLRHELVFAWDAVLDATPNAGLAELDADIVVLACESYVDVGGAALVSTRVSDSGSRTVPLSLGAYELGLNLDARARASASHNSNTGATLSGTASTEASVTVTIGRGAP